MREIKFKSLFRHIGTRKEIWFQSMPNHILGNMSGYVRITGWLQFTGLKDKNGKEIYEGDIVKDYNCDFIDDKSEVVFHNGYYYPLVQHEEGYNCISGYSPERFEVIGNLHEHPDLISS